MKTAERKKYLIVGANSFLSNRIIEKLKGTNEVVGVYHKETNNLHADIVNVSIEEMEKFEDCFEIVFIISAYIPDKKKNVDVKALNEVNVLLPGKIIEKFKRAKLVYASSVSVYGDAEGTLNESSVGKNISLYGESKIKGEDIIKKSGNYSILRISSVYGEGMKLSTFLPLIVKSAILNGTIKLTGDGSRFQNYIHVDDVAEFFIKAAYKDENNTYLAVAAQSVSNREVAAMVVSLLNNIIIRYSDVDHSPSFFYDAAFTYEELAYKPQKKILQGIEELIKWQQKIF